MPVTYYDVSNSVPFNGSTLTNTSNGCDVDRLSSTILLCDPDSKLDDDNTGPMAMGPLLSDDLGSFFAFSQQTDQPRSVWFTLDANTSNLSVILYFFNNPMESIGLPSTISALTTGYMALPFTYDNNSDLTQTDSTVRSVVLHLSNTDPINSIRLDFDFNDTNIDWFLLSEVDIIQNGKHFVKFLSNL